MSLMEGWVEKRGGKTANKDWKKRWLVATTAGLKYFVKPGGELKGIIDLTDIQGASSVPNFQKRAAVFEISTPDHRYVIDAGDDSTRRQWLKAITELRQKKTRPGKEIAAPAAPKEAGALPFAREEAGEHISFSARTGSTMLSSAGQTVAARRRAFEWDAQECVVWLKALTGLQSDWAAVLLQGHVDGETLLDELKTKADWIELGVAADAHGDLVLLVAAAEELRQAETK